MQNRFLFYSISLYVVLLLSACQSDDYVVPSFKEHLKDYTYAIGQSSYTIVDSVRSRPIKAEVWYPTHDTTKVNKTLDYPFKLKPVSNDAETIAEKFPLILFSHGTGGNRISQMWLASELVSNGFIVLSVDHYGNTLDHKIPENFVKVWDRPLDITFVLSDILNNPMYRSIIDTSRIGMLGFSLGGYTTIALAGGEIDFNLLQEYSKSSEGQKEFHLPELGDVSKYITPDIIKQGNTTYKKLKDDRIQAHVAMAPALGQGFKEQSQFKVIDTPMLIIGAENDQRTPVKTNAKHYHNLIDGSDYIELPGKVGHYVFMNEAKSGLKRAAPQIFKDDASINRKAQHDKISKIVVDYFSKQFSY